MNCSYSWGLARSVANIPSELHWRNWFFSCKQVSIAYIFLARSESSKGDSGIYGRIGRKIVRGDRWLQGNIAFQIQQVLRFYLWCTYALIEIAAACTGLAQFQARGPSTGRGKWSKRAQSDPLGLCFLLWENQTKVGCLPSSVWGHCSGSCFLSPPMEHWESCIPRQAGTALSRKELGDSVELAMCQCRDSNVAIALSKQGCPWQTVSWDIIQKCLSLKPLQLASVSHRDQTVTSPERRAQIANLASKAKMTSHAASIVWYVPGTRGIHVLYFSVGMIGAVLQECL